MIKTNLRSKSDLMKVYDKESPVYYPKRFSSPGGRYIDFAEKAFLTQYGRGPSFLEIGTATGRFVGFVEKSGWDYTGIDISSRMLQLSRSNGANLVQADAEEIPLRSDMFDTIICLHTFHFLPDPLACVQESKRVLKPSGLLILIFETDNWLRRIAIKTGMFESDQYYFRTEEVTNMIQSNGLTPIAQGPILKFPMDLYRKLPITKLLKQLDSSQHWPAWFATLGFAIGRKNSLSSPL